MNHKFYFLVALTAVLAATANARGPVLDGDGDPIFSGSYYVLPLFFGPAGGGLTLAPLEGINPCPLYVGQESSEVEKGIPVKFSNWKTKVAFVPESENLNINMDIEATTCVQSPYWWLRETDGKWLIKAGPKPEEDSPSSLFQIKKTEDALTSYKIAVCPSYDRCMSVGIFVDENGVRRLALSSKPFPVVFVKATGSKTMSII